MTSPPQAPAPAGDSAVGWGGFLGHVRNYLLGGAVSGLVGFGTVSILTRLLTPAEYGVFRVWAAIVAVLTVLVELNFRGAVSRYFLEERDDFPDFLNTILRFLGALAVFNLAVAWLLRAPLGAFVELSPDLFVLATLAAIAQVGWNLNWTYMTARLASAGFAALRVSRDLLVFGVGALWVVSLPATVPTDAYGGRELGQVYGVLLVNLAFSIALALKLWRIARTGRPHRRHLVYALAFGVPLIPHALSGQVLAVFDRVIINKIEGERSAGLYAFAYDVGAVMAMVVQSMNAAWQPLFTRARNREQYAHIDAMASAYAQYIAALALFMVLFAHELGRLLADARYGEALKIVPLVVLSYVALFMYTIYANHSFYRYKTALISAATLIAGATNVGLNLWLIPRHGYGVAAWTTLASYLLLFVLHYSVARFILRETVARVSRLTLWFAVAALGSWLVTLAEAALPSYLLTLFVLKLPAVALLALWMLRVRRHIKALLTPSPA